jgi:hypothetical protein
VPGRCCTHCGSTSILNEGKTKQSIVDFVEQFTKEGSPDFVPVAERIATFDIDGTLRCDTPRRQTLDR